MRPAALETRRTDAHRRLIFEEFFFLQLASRCRARRATRAAGGRPAQVDDALRDRLRAVLPFHRHQRAAQGAPGDCQRPESTRP